MRLLVGLGNPGTKYLKNRHNVGHMFIDYALNELTESRNNGFKLLKTDCYMNQSGQFVKRFLSKNPQLKTDDLYIVHDDLDIEFGKFKIQFGVGPKLHNGILSIEKEIDTTKFWRIRIGVDSRNEENKIEGELYALQDFSYDELTQLKVIFTSISDKLKNQ